MEICLKAMCLMTTDIWNGELRALVSSLVSRIVVANACCSLQIYHLMDHHGLNLAQLENRLPFIVPHAHSLLSGSMYLLLCEGLCSSWS